MFTIGAVELASNLAWVVTTLCALAGTLWAIRRGAVRLPPVTALLVVLSLCFLLLPVISVSDDILEQNQAALPLSGQTWHMAWEGASVGLELVSIVSACLLLLACAAPEVARLMVDGWVEKRHICQWLTRSQRLRPPPAHL